MFRMKNVLQIIMSKTLHRHRALALIATLIVLAICPLLFACNNDKPVYDTSSCYELDMDLSDDRLDVSQEILYVSPADSDCLVLHVYANAFSKGKDVIDISSAQINRKTVDYEIYGKDRTLLKLHYPVSSGQHLNISFKYAITLPRSNTRLGITTKGVTNLACFYPVMAKYENGWREDEYSSFGDPFYHDIASFYVNLTVDKDTEIACSGRITDTRLVSENGRERKTVEIEAEHIRDFALTVGDMRKVSDTVEIGGKTVDVNYCFFLDPYPSRTLDRIKSALSVFSETFGAYPYDTFTLAETMFDDAGGMEYGAFSVVSLCNSIEAYYDTVTHETAHQWWYGAVGSDQINSAWLDEGLTEFCTYYYHYLTGDRARFNEEMASISRSYSAFSAHKGDVGFNGEMERPLSSYLTDGEYVAVCYFKGAMLFDTLRGLAGDKKFALAMQRYFKDNLFKVATASSLINAFKAEGLDVSGIVNAWIEDKNSF